MVTLTPGPIPYWFEQDGRTKKGQYRKGFTVDYYPERRLTVWTAHKLPLPLRDASRWSCLDDRLPLVVHGYAIGNHLAAEKLADLVQEISGAPWVWKLLMDDPDWWREIERLLMRSEQEELRQRRTPAHLPHVGNPFVS